MKCQWFQCDLISPNRSGGPGGKEERKGEGETEKKERKGTSSADWSRDLESKISSVTQSCLTLCDPMNCSMPGLPVHHQLLEFTQTHVHWVGDAIQPTHPLSSPSPPAFTLSQHQGLFQRVGSLHQVATVLEFQMSTNIPMTLTMAFPSQGCGSPLSEKELNQFYDSLQLSHSKMYLLLDFFLTFF